MIQRNNQRICDDCKKASPDAQLPWHRHPDKIDAWLCSTCYARRYYAAKKKFKTREEQYKYLSIKFSGSSNPFFGKRHTDETKRKISIKKTGVPLPESTRLRMIGRTISEQTRRKLSAALKGRPSPMKGKHHSVESKTRIAYMNLGKTHTDETKKKLSVLMKGEKNHMYGKHVAEETKKKISESLLGPKNPSFGKKVSEETRRLISQKNKGRPWNKGLHPSDATRNKMSTSHIGIYPSAETLAKRSLALTGLKRKPVSLEARANMSRAHVGKKPSEETRLKMRKCTLNESAFSTVAPDSAYWIGYLIADGNVSIKKGSSVIALHVKEIDKNHLIKFRAFVGSSHKLGRYVSKTRGNISCSISFHSERMAEDLAGYGVVPDKWFIVKVKGGVENNKDLWRGIIDGDGHLGIYLRRCKNGSLRPIPYISLTSNLNVCLQFKAFLEKSLGFLMPNIVPDKKSYQLWISDHRALRVITLLYTNCGLALDRKLADAQNIMNSFQLIGRSRYIRRT
jgi:hypothetical protein